MQASPSPDMYRPFAHACPSAEQFRPTGTDDIWYGQIGYLMAKDLLGSNNGQLMPYFSFTSANFQRLRDQMNVFNVGVNWLIKGHNSKVTFDYQNRRYSTPREAKSLIAVSSFCNTR
jgi:hypothetical protein